MESEMDNSEIGSVRRRRLVASLAALGGIGMLPSVRAGEAPGGHDHDAHKAHMTQMAQMAEAAQSASRPRQVRYQVPAVTLLDQRGRKVAFDKALDDGRPVILNFIFTSCTTICPVMTQIFMQVQAQLAGEAGKVHMVSVSIDPEYDTPARLLDYTRQHGAGAQWDFYTGTNAASIQVQQAFDAYRGDKMNHEPLVVVRGPHGGNWLRLDGFASAQAIVDAYRALAA
jgi:protein SCO1/2